MPEVQAGDVVHLLPRGIDALNEMYEHSEWGVVMCPYPTVVRASSFHDGTQNILRARVNFTGGYLEVLLINGINDEAEWEQVAAIAQPAEDARWTGTEWVCTRAYA